MFKIHQDITQAETLPSSFYNDAQYFQLSKEKIFERTWQFIGDVDELKLAEQNFPLTLLPGFLDEPILLTRDKQDNLHCISNVCTHRGNILVEHSCNQSQIRCRYHGRKFNLEGNFISMPEFEGVQNFPSPKDNLPKVPFAQFEKFLFASVNPFMQLKDCIAEMKSRLSWMNMKDLKLNQNLSRDYLVKANWALYCENYLEGFHIPFVHNALNKMIDYGSYATELYRYASLQIGYSKDAEHVFDLPGSSSDYGKNIAAYYYWIFPNMMFNFYPWGVSVNIIKPMSPNLTKVSFITYVSDESKLGDGAGAALDKVEREDEAIVENVQRGVRSKFYNTGRYSPTRETGTHHFHRLIAEFMNY
ncbi:MAG: SRPBCC family protein [Bacteroidia bacterium]